MIVILAKHTNGEMALVGTTSTIAQARTVGEAIVQAPQWQDVFFLPATSEAAVNAAMAWTTEYFIDNPPLQRKLADDPLLQMMLAEAGQQEP